MAKAGSTSSLDKGIGMFKRGKESEETQSDEGQTKNGGRRPTVWRGNPSATCHGHRGNSRHVLDANAARASGVGLRGVVVVE